ncbi:MAG: Na/Pi cotransporter family protein [Candidatus Peregrinibacteria bacterium]|nr:Na/Pi cotransporter family protein [Candidatus Peregrinibacteria bacterium]
MNWQIFIGVLVGLIIFMHGIENFSREVLSFAGKRFRSALRMATKNRFSSGLVGVIVTALIQSSTATTVITIGLVSAGVISFMQSLGVIFGANIGTTITGQFVAFKITAFAPYFIIFGFLLSLLGKSYRYIGKGLFYFGLVFFGLHLIADAIEPIKSDPRVLEIFANLNSPYLAILAGFLLTAIVHSSSVTTGIVVLLASSGILSLNQGIPILLGSNIGTTITAIIASSRLNLFAKRAATAHTIFNIVGVLLLLPFLQKFILFISSLGGSTAQQMANAHTIFNVAIAMIFILLRDPIHDLVMKIIPGKEKEILIGTKHLKKQLPKSNAASFRLIEKEVSYTLEIASELYDTAITSLTSEESPKEEKIDKYETLVDLLDERVEGALLELSKRKLTESEAKRITILVRISNLTEQLADSAKTFGRLRQFDSISASSFSPEALTDVQRIYEKIQEALQILKKEFPNPIPEYTKVIRHLDSIQNIISRGYSGHIKRLQTKGHYGSSLFVEAAALLEDATEKVKQITQLSQRYSRF